MKTLIYIFVSLSLLAGLLFSPALSAPAAAAACGDTYTVLWGDYLSKIAKTCGVSLSSLISNNPEIKDVNRIFPGQVIRITSSGTVPVTGDGTTYTVVKGDYLSLIAQRFGTTVSALLSLNPSIVNPSILYVGQVIKLPSGSTTPTTSNAYITLSTRSAKVGAQVEVKVNSFPANADIDFRIGKEGAAYSAVVDGKTDSKGAATTKVTIPSAAKVGEKWVVKVLTTSMAGGKEATSLTITIIK
jgi:LysM repeat protein